jgi:hypothetical protein
MTMLEKIKTLILCIRHGDGARIRSALRFYSAGLINRLPRSMQSGLAALIDNFYQQVTPKPTFFDTYIKIRKPWATAHGIPIFDHHAPRVSIITRTYAGRRLYLEQAIQSVRLQDYPNIEHIIVEDGGATYSDFISARTGDLVYIPLEKVGRSVAGNTGIKRATGEYCLFLDDDDMLLCNHVSTLVQALQTRQDCVAAYTLSLETPTIPAPDLTHYHELSFAQPYGGAIAFDINVLKQRNFLPIQSVLFKRTLFLERGGFEAELEALEDWDLWQRYARGNCFVYAPVVTSLYRVPGNFVRYAQRQAILNQHRQIILDKHVRLD